MQVGSCKPTGEKLHKNWIWEGLGLYLGGVWEALGHLLAALGRSKGAIFRMCFRFFCASQPILRFFCDFWSQDGAKTGFGRVLEGFGKGLGRIWGGFGMIWGSFGKGARRFLKGSFTIKRFSNFCASCVSTVAPHTLLQEPPRYLAAHRGASQFQAIFFEKKREHFGNAPKRIRTRPDASEWIRMYPNKSKEVPTSQSKEK